MNTSNAEKMMRRILRAISARTFSLRFPWKPNRRISCAIFFHAFFQCELNGKPFAVRSEQLQLCDHIFRMKLHSKKWNCNFKNESSFLKLCEPFFLRALFYGSILYFFPNECNILCTANFPLIIAMGSPPGMQSHCPAKKTLSSPLSVAGMLKRFLLFFVTMKLI